MDDLVDLVKLGGTAYYVVMDGTHLIVIARNVHSAIRVAFEWWRDDPDNEADADEDIPLERVEPLTEAGAIVVEYDVLTARSPVGRSEVL